MAPGHENREWESLQLADRSVRTYFRDLTGLVSQMPYNSITQIVSIFLDAFAEQRTVWCLDGCDRIDRLDYLGSQKAGLVKAEKVDNRGGEAPCQVLLPRPGNVRP